MADHPQPPPLRRITQVYIASSAAAALSTFFALVSAAEFPSSGQIALALALATGVALAFLFPINAGHREMFTVETVAVIPAILLFEPGIAILIAVVGSTVAMALRPLAAWLPRELRQWDLAQEIFNLSFMTLKVAAGSLSLWLVQWEPEQANFSFPTPVAPTIVAGMAMYIVDRIGLAGIIAYQERLSLPSVFSDLTLGAQPVEHVQYVAQLGIGLLAATVADTYPWALLLLLLPLASVYAALQRHVAMRRRAEANLAAAQEVADLGSLDWDLRKDDQRWSNALYHLLGLDPTTPATVETYLKLVHPDDRPAVTPCTTSSASIPRLPPRSRHISSSSILTIAQPSPPRSTPPARGLPTRLTTGSFGRTAKSASSTRAAKSSSGATAGQPGSSGRCTTSRSGSGSRSGSPIRRSTIR